MGVPALLAQPKKSPEVVFVCFFLLFGFFLLAPSSAAAPDGVPALLVRARVVRIRGQPRLKPLHAVPHLAGSVENAFSKI